MPDKRDEYRTFLGSCLSAITIFTLVIFSAWKLLALVTSSDYKVQVHEQKQFYEDSAKLTLENDGFLMAAAITAFDENPYDITDLEIGELKFIRKRWGPGIPFTMTPIASKPCNEIENIE